MGLLPVEMDSAMVAQSLRSCPALLLLCKQTSAKNASSN